MPENELMEKVCSRLGAGAYGRGRISVIPVGHRDEVRFADGGRLIRLGAVIRAQGYESEDVLIGYLEEAYVNASGSSGDPEVRVFLPPVMTERNEDGFKAFEAECEIIFEAGV